MKLAMSKRLLAMQEMPLPCIQVLRSQFCPKNKTQNPHQPPTSAADIVLASGADHMKKQIESSGEHIG
jgi:hypothetical protein